MKKGVLGYKPGCCKPKRDLHAGCMPLCGCARAVGRKVVVYVGTLCKHLIVEDICLVKSELMQPEDALCLRAVGSIVCVPN